MCCHDNLQDENDAVLEWGTPDKAGVLRMFKDILVHNTPYQQLKKTVVAAMVEITEGMDKNTHTRYVEQTTKRGFKALAASAIEAVKLVVPEGLVHAVYSAASNDYEDYFGRVQEAIRRELIYFPAFGCIYKILPFFTAHTFTHVCRDRVENGVLCYRAKDLFVGRWGRALEKCWGESWRNPAAFSEA